MNILNISNSNFDGYLASFLLNEYILHKHGTNFTFIQLNVNYNEIHDAVGSLTKDIDLLYITDLTLNLNTTNKLCETISKVNPNIKVVLINHNVIPRAVLNRLEESVKSFKLIYVPGKSTSRTIIEKLDDGLNSNIPLNHPFKKFINVVTFADAWDMHLMHDSHAFSRGQLFNDFFIELILLFSYTNKPDKIKLINTYFRFINNVSFTSSEVPLTTIDTIIRTKLPMYLLDSFWSNRSEDDYQFGRVSNSVNLLGFKQAVSLIVAYSITTAVAYSPKTITILDNSEHVATVLLTDSETCGLNIPMSIVHHLLYTLKSIDIAIMLHDNGKVEMRQAAERATHSLGEMAKVNGGGGSTSTAGFYIRAETNPIILNKEHIMDLLLEHRL